MSLGNEFILSGRRLVWHESASATGAWVDVVSGDYHVRIIVTGDVATYRFLGPMIVLGSEFPLGQRAVEPPFLATFLSMDRDRHSQIHSELIRAIVQRYHRIRAYQRHPLTALDREKYDVPRERWPESVAEREKREADERELLERMAAIAAKDARLTDRRCPHCGQPCPSYRVTCKHCGRPVRGLLEGHS